MNDYYYNATRKQQRCCGCGTRQLQRIRVRMWGTMVVCRQCKAFSWDSLSFEEYEARESAKRLFL